MKYFIKVVLVLLFCGFSVFSQDNNLKHTIVKGETISSIAQKYNVPITSIYKLNPKAKKTLQLNQILFIPDSKFNNDKDISNSGIEKIRTINHQVVPKETLYGIAKEYNTTLELLYKANPQLEAEGLKEGQTISIPSVLTKNEITNLSNDNSQALNTLTEPVTHKVRARESLYAIAKDYEITLKELQEANPEIGKKGLSIGQLIQIPNIKKLSTNTVNKPQFKQASVVETKLNTPIVSDNTANNIETNSPAQIVTLIHEVLPKETKYGIAKKYDITVAILENQNPSIRQKLIVGEKLNIQVSYDTTTVKTNKDEVVAKRVEQNKDTTSSSIYIANQDLIDQLIQSASEKIGSRYRTGGTTTSGFDCSGLMCATFGAFNIKLPRSSIEQASFGEQINDVNAQKGDLIFFKTNGRRQINHVGIVVEVTDDEIKFIHSSIHSGVIISSTKESYYQRNFAQVNRVLK